MKYLSYEKEGEIALLKIKRPEALNALNTEMLKELREFLEHKVPNDHLKVLIITGEGDKAFIAGADIKEMNEMKHTQVLDFLELGQQVTLLFENAHFITIAAVNGYALGGGLEMALACDFIYASKKARLGLPEVTLGIIPGFGGTQRLSRSIGTRRAKEMIAKGKTVSAEEAYQLGFVNFVCEPEELMDKCYETAKEIAKHSLVTVQQSKNAVNSGYQLGIHEALEVERNMFVVCFATEERKALMEEFLKKK